MANKTVKKAKADQIPQCSQTLDTGEGHEENCMEFNTSFT